MRNGGNEVGLDLGCMQFPADAAVGRISAAEHQKEHKRSSSQPERAIQAQIPGRGDAVELDPASEFSLGKGAANVGSRRRGIRTPPDVARI